MGMESGGHAAAVAAAAAATHQHPMQLRLRGVRLVHHGGVIDREPVEAQVGR
jgi:hypothetical protein